MAIKLSDVTDPMTTSDVESSFNAVYSLFGLNTSGWLVGHVIKAFTKGASIALAGCHQLICTLANGAYLETATGDWLTLKTKYDWDTERVEAAQATGFITLTNPSANVYVLSAFEVTVAHATTGKQYRNSEGFTLGANSSVIVPILAVESGTASNASVGAITVIVSGLSGCTVSNQSAVIGVDAEGDGDLRERARQSPSLHSAASASGAYEAVARAAKRTDNTPIGVTRAAHTIDGYGNVNLYVAGASGTVSQPDLDRITEVVGTTIEGVGVNCVAYAAVAKTVSVNLTVYVTGAVASETVKQRVQSTMLAFAAEQDIGGVKGWLYKDQITIAAGTADASIYHVVVNTPVNDVAIASNEYPILNLTVSVSS